MRGLFWLEFFLSSPEIVGRLLIAVVAGRLCDLSPFGCRIESEGAHAAGDRVWLRLAGGLPIAATVVWSDGGRTGCRFDEGLPRETVRALTLGIA